MPTPIDIRSARENIARALKELNKQIAHAERNHVTVEPSIVDGKVVVEVQKDG